MPKLPIPAITELTKLPKGVLRVVHIDAEATEENSDRHQVGGRIFVPPFTVYEFEDADALPVGIHKCFGVKGNLTLRTALSDPPFQLTGDNELGLSWLESTGELTLYPASELTR